MEDKKATLADLEQYVHSVGILTPNFLNNLRFKLILDTYTRFFFKKFRVIDNVQISYDSHNMRILFIFTFNKIVYFVKKKKLFKKIQNIISESLPVITNLAGQNVGFDVEITYEKKHA